ncbi:sensor domain-containing diguanylate cyclase [Anabaena cylindrica UHCC 0172]|uniref:sensor domain-containing diguanylate cyclase n=1 Tax=Anabaena cylindrica TaxID=1165 RepID=UPI002B2118C2|nr:sensor domain-containing diguanylate cyclase [Anabaena cylindrica]MEA5553664.1 sensor domain-containing diguanylate cyclase [Anabaena cylindrica UHCC 0172]
MFSDKFKSILQLIATKFIDLSCIIFNLPTIRQLQAQLQEQKLEIQKKEEKEKALYRVISKIRASLDIESIFRTTTKETCKLLGVERIAVYRFHEDWGGEFVNDFEFVEPGIDTIQMIGENTVWNDSYLQEHQGGRYRNNETLYVADIYEANLSQCHIEVLEQFQIRAYATAPIFVRQELWGVLSAYQHSQPYNWQKSDIQFLTQVASQLGFAVQQAEMLTEMEQKIIQLNQANQRQQILFDLVVKIRESLDMEVLFKTTVREVRKVLQVDRVGIFKFHLESNYYSGEFMAENVLPMYDSAIAVKIEDHCFSNNYALLYQQGRSKVVPNIYETELHECHLQILEQFQIKAQIIFPLTKGDELWGLLCVHQCSAARSWTDVEVQFIKQLATQFSVALQHSELLESTKIQAQKLADINQSLEKANSSLEQLSNIDSLTKIANRRRFDEYLAIEWQRHLREQQFMTLILIDIDYFKRYNDYYGHQGGDECLIQVAQAIALIPQRSIDLVARYGGEEFAAILPNTNIEGGLIIAEVIKNAIASLAITHPKSEVSNYVTLSLGVASMIPNLETTPESLIAYADEALYTAKREGRNRAIAHTLVD